MYINGAVALGKPFWRDKIRYLVKHRLAGAFLVRFPDYARSLPHNGELFFAASKSRWVDSERLDRHLDAFLSAEVVERIPNHAQPIHEIRPSRLLQLVNHGSNHYLLASTNPKPPVVVLA